MFSLPTSPAVLAVLFGVLELFILESFRFLLVTAQATRRRIVLYRSANFNLPAAVQKRARLKLYINIISTVAIIVLVVMQLSIDAIRIRSSGAPISAMCAAPQRIGRYLGGFGPDPSEANDTRLPSYLEQTGCENSLLSEALSGTGGLQIGLPSCTAPFDDARERTFLAEFRGCNVGIVANSGAGDFHCDLLPVGSDIELSLKTIDFIAVLEDGGVSDAGLGFNGNASQRYLANVRVPNSWRLNSTEESVSVDCRDLREFPLECYRSSIESAETAAKTVRERTARSGVYIQVLQNGNSTVCLFENGMRSRAEWLDMHHSLPLDYERTSRRGPVLTGFEVSGEARCIQQLDAQTARLHYDAVEYAQGAPQQDLLDWLQRYVVGTGIKTPFESSRECEVFAWVDGSSINRGWFIAACIVSGALVLICAVALVYIMWARLCKDLKSDPLAPLWSIRAVLRMRRARRPSSEDRDAETLGDAFIGVVERDGYARFDVFENDKFEAVASSKRPFLFGS